MPASPATINKPRSLARRGCCSREAVPWPSGIVGQQLVDEDDVLERATFDSLFAEGGEPVDVSEMTGYGLAATEVAFPGSARYYWETYNILGDRR